MSDEERLCIVENTLQDVMDKLASLEKKYDSLKEGEDDDIKEIGIFRDQIAELKESLNEVAQNRIGWEENIEEVLRDHIDEHFKIADADRDDLNVIHGWKGKLILQLEKLDSPTLPDPYYACGKEKDSGGEKDISRMSDLGLSPRKSQEGRDSAVDSKLPEPKLYFCENCGNEISEVEHIVQNLPEAKPEKSEPSFETKGYISLKLSRQFDVVKLRDMINDLIGGDNAIGISMNWADLAEIFLKVDGSWDKRPEFYHKYDIVKHNDSGG